MMEELTIEDLQRLQLALEFLISHSINKPLEFPYCGTEVMKLYQKILTMQWKEIEK